MAAVTFAMNSCHPQSHMTWLGGSEQAKAFVSAKYGAQSRTELFDLGWRQKMEK